MHNVHRRICPNIYPDPVCRDNFTLHHYDPPLLYDLHHDPGEIYNLDVKKYQDVMDEISKVQLVDRLGHVNVVSVCFFLSAQGKV